MEKTETENKKQVMVVGVDDSDFSAYALEWTLDHFFKNSSSDLPYELVLVHAKKTPTAAIGIGGPASGAIDVMPYVDADLSKIAATAVDKTKEICNSKLGKVVDVEVVDGDARNVLCEAVERYQASILVVGSHGYGALKRAVLGSVSDYCAHHAHCTVMIVKKPKAKN